LKSILSFKDEAVKTEVSTIAERFRPHCFGQLLKTYVDHKCVAAINVFQFLQSTKTFVSELISKWDSNHCIFSGQSFLLG
jgi:hypothetical protein